MANFSDSFSLSVETLKKLDNLPIKVPETRERRLTRSKTQSANSDDEVVEASPNSQENTRRKRKEGGKSIRKNKSDSLLGKYVMNPAQKLPDISTLNVTMLEKLLEDVEEEEIRKNSEGVLEKPISTQDIIDIDFSDWEMSSDFQGFQEEAEPAQPEAVEPGEIFNIDNVTFVAEPTTDQEMKACRREISQMIRDFHEGDDSFEEFSQILTRKEEEPSHRTSQTPLLTPKATEATSLDAWGLPDSILRAYARKGITKMFQWQVECLSNRRTLLQGDNLVYSAPTSAGKTLVSEILMIKSVLERQRKALLILPFISVVREKMLYLQDLLSPAGVRVEGFYGGYAPPGGLDACHVAVCTIEKANSIFNRLLEHQLVHQVGIVVVDEIHLISDPNRGYILELLLAKILCVSRKLDMRIQVVGMSATLPNLQLLCRWLSAQLYTTDFRPVELREMIKIGTKIYSNRLEEIRTLDVKEFSSICNLRNQDDVGQLVVETVSEGCGVIVFCPSKDRCEKLCLTLAETIYIVGKSQTPLGAQIRDAINREAIASVRQELINSPTGLDEVLAKCIGYACAFHHAGLTTEERDAIEGGFRTGALRVLVATSTLSSGVNLPARRVIVRSPMFGGKPMNPLTYRQMIGRAGRTGKDTLGEAILICDETNAKAGKELLTRDLTSISSCLDVRHSGNLRRALLEIVASGMATSLQDLQLFFSCTLIWAEKGEIPLEINRRKSLSDDDDNDDSVRDCVAFLLKYEFLREQEDHLVATRLGYACLASSIPPADGFLLFSELQKSRQCFVLESELHAIYLVTPFSVCQQLPELDWLHYLDLWERLPATMRRVGELVGVRDAFLVRAMRGTRALDEKHLQIHKRFYTALALQELIQETPMARVAAKYKCSRGLLQSLQQMAASFAAIVASFCSALNWQLLAMIVAQFRERLFFGIQRDLVDLMRVPSLNAQRARALFSAGIESLLMLARTETSRITKILLDCVSFDTEGQREGEADHEARERITLRKYYITGRRDLTVNEAAKIIKSEARRIIELEMGGIVNWEDEEVPVLEKSLKNLSICSLEEIPGSQETSKRQILRSKRNFEVMKDEKSFRKFSQRILSSPEVAVAVILEEKHLKMTNIGVKLFNGNDNPEDVTEDFRVDQKRILSALAITCDGRDVELVDFTRKTFIEKLFNRSDVLIHMWDVRENLKLLARVLGAKILDTRATFQDPQVANWLLQPDEATTSLHRIVMLHCPDLEGLLTPPEVSNSSPAMLKGASECAIVFNLRSITAKLAAIGDGRLLRVFRDLEMPIQVSLARMESLGFPVNATEMEKLLQDCESQMNQLEKMIFSLHGKKFNISSAKAVAKALGIAKDKGKVSTTRSVLEKLGTPLSQLINQHRTLTAVFRKTIQPLSRSVHVNRIHGVSCSLTQTGRITMHEPNLQTVAKDFQLDFGGSTKILSCRRVFAPKNNRCLISADFCQLELRILIHFSQDPSLIKMIKSECDIFRAVAARWNAIAEPKVTPKMRHDAKQICYGIIYGMGARSLAESLKIDEVSARERIEGFYRVYPAIRSFTERLVKETRVRGFIETLSGRRRFLEHITSQDSALRAQAERQAVNSMIQGSAADVAKSALLAVERKWTDKSVNFVLHVHDELIFEAPRDLVDEFAGILRESMENCWKLSIPLRVKIKSGANWAEMTEISC